MGKIFGGGSKSTSTSQSGYGVLPGYAKNFIKRSIGEADRILDDPDAYFRPMDLTAGEQAAKGFLGRLSDPSQTAGLINQFMNPFRDIIFQDINRGFEQGPMAQFKQGADMAGAFGGSRFGRGVYDLGRAQSDAISSASSGLYDAAYGKISDAISKLLGFGGFERDLDLSQRQALPQALGLGQGLYTPLLSGSTSTQTQKSGGGGIGSSLAGIGLSLATGGLGAPAAFGLSTGGQSLLGGGLGNMIGASRGFFGPGF